MYSSRAGKETGKEWYQHEGLVLHDVRRSAVRNLIRAGVDVSTAMKITGHRSLNVFLRYNIVSTSDLHEGLEKAASMKAAAKRSAVTQNQRKTEPSL